MTRFLARLADVAYRRRGRMVLVWIVAAAWIPNWLERILPRLDVERVAVGAAESRS